MLEEAQSIRKHQQGLFSGQRARNCTETKMNGRLVSELGIGTSKLPPPWKLNDVHSLPRVEWWEMVSARASILGFYFLLCDRVLAASSLRALLIYKGGIHPQSK